MGGGVDGAFGPAQKPEHMERSKRPHFDVDTYINKGVRAFETPGLRLKKAGANGAGGESALNGSDRLPDEGMAVADIGADVEVGNCH